MNRSENWQLLNMLNKNDRELYSQMKRRRQPKLLLSTFMFSIVFTTVISVIVFFFSDSLLISMTSSMLILVLFVYFVIKFSETETHKQWLNFLEEKSIIFNTPDFNSLKSALEDHIYRDINYYTDERVIDRRAVEKFEP